MARTEAVAGWLMAGPWIVGFLLLTAVLILASILFAFCDYDVLHPPRYVGAANFAQLSSQMIGNSSARPSEMPPTWPPSAFRSGW